MQAPAARPAKATPRTTIKILDLRAGTYRVLSSDGITWYVADVAHNTCDCPAGANGFRNCAKQGGMCRHLHAAHGLAAVLRARRLAARQPAPAAPAPRSTQRTCAGCGAVYFGTAAAGWCACSPAPEPIDLAARRAARPAFVPAIPELAELFG